MFYAMAKNPDYFNTKVSLFVALAPGLYYSNLKNVFDYDYYFAPIDGAGIFVINGPTWVTDRKRLCDQPVCLNAIYPCGFPLEVPQCSEYPEIPAPGGQPIVIKDFKWNQQNTINAAFNEYNPYW